MIRLSDISQKIQTASRQFPVGSKVCNVKVGAVGTVTGVPFVQELNDVCHIFLPTNYADCVNTFDDIDVLLTVSDSCRDAITNVKA